MSSAQWFIRRLGPLDEHQGCARGGQTTDLASKLSHHPLILALPSPHRVIQLFQPLPRPLNDFLRIIILETPDPLFKLLLLLQDFLTHSPKHL